MRPPRFPLRRLVARVLAAAALACAAAGPASAEDVAVSSNVRGAAILLNGLDTGYRTPAVIPNVSPGMVQVSVVDTCNRGEAIVNVLAGQTNRVSVLATEQMGTLVVEATPPGAEIDVDNGRVRVSGSAPIGLPCGRHTVRASLDGYMPSVVPIDLAGGQELVLPVRLQKLGLGGVELSVRPRSATLLLDDSPVGTDAVTLPSVPEGVHTVGARQDGYKTVTRQVLVSDGQQLAFHFDLERAGGRKESAVVATGASAAALVAEAAVSSEQAGSDPAPGVASREEAAREEAAREKARERAAREREEREEREAAEREEREEREAAERAAAERAAAAERDAQLAAEREAARREQERVAAARKKATERKSKSGGGAWVKDVAGGLLIAGGVGTGAGAVLAYSGAANSYEAYQKKVDAAEEQEDRFLAREADEYYEEYVLPRSTLFYATAAATPLLLAGGVVLVLIDAEGPAVVPAPGGALFTWSARF